MLGLLVGAGLGVGGGAVAFNADDAAVAELPVVETQLQRIAAGPEPFFGEAVVWAGR